MEDNKVEKTEPLEDVASRDLERRLRHLKGCLVTNAHILTVDGLFAGFAFAGALEILMLEAPSHYQIAAFVSLILATFFFALRINIAIRLIWTIHTRKAEAHTDNSPGFRSMAHLGQRLEGIAILFFWFSLIPLSLSHSTILGGIVSGVLCLSALLYRKIITLWKVTNKELKCHDKD